MHNYMHVCIYIYIERERERCLNNKPTHVQTTHTINNKHKQACSMCSPSERFSGGGKVATSESGGDDSVRLFRVASRKFTASSLFGRERLGRLPSPVPLFYYCYF